MNPSFLTKVSVTPRFEGGCHPHQNVGNVPKLAYSNLNATNGSIRAARHAGTQHATIATTSSTAAVTNSVEGSVVLTPLSHPFSVRLSMSAIAWPAANPSTASRSPFLITSDNTCQRAAPIAIRMPISCVLCATEYEITPYSPTAAKTNASAANEPSSSI